VSDELRWAVTDGPAGTHAVALPEDGLDARRLALHYGGEFFCSRQAGGCGGRLVLSAGDGVRPYFRHPGSPPCAFLGRGSAAGRAYEPLRYRRALEAWLARQGVRCRLEQLPDPDGGANLLVVAEDGSHAVRVQLSPLPDTAWRRLDDRYRARARHVTWLYGPAAGAAAATEAAVRGVSFAVRRHDVGLAVGVRDVDDRTRWVRLAACRLTADGVAVPGAESARALHARRTTEREEAARRMAQQAARRSRAGEGAGGARASGRATATTPWGPTLSPLPFPG
jgi:hypothetical protein